MAERLLVDGMNVIGSRPDGWWRDRPAAVRALVAALREYAERTGARITVVFDGAPTTLPPAGDVTVGFATSRGRGAADDEIVRLVQRAAEPAGITVVTSDGPLRARAHALGASVTPAGALRRRLDAAAPRL